MHESIYHVYQQFFCPLRHLLVVERPAARALPFMTNKKPTMKRRCLVENMPALEALEAE